jgi:DNA-binding transcriptional ArsR family regulator
VIDLPGVRASGVRSCVSPLVTLMASIFEGWVGWRRGCPESWVRYVNAACEGVELSALDIYRAPRRVIPDFTGPSALVTARSIEEVLAHWREYEPGLVADQIGETFSNEVPPVYRAYLEDPAAAIDELCSAIERYWSAVLAPLWPRIESLLDREVLALGRALVQDGLPALLARLGSGARVVDDRLEWGRLGQKRHICLDDRTLLFVPMLSGPDASYSVFDQPEHFVIGYPVPGAEEVWGAVDSDIDDHLTTLLGRTRARVLVAAETGASTQEVARRLTISPSLASHHLAFLRRAGLVDTARVGRRVYYRLTDRGQRLRDAIER